MAKITLLLILLPLMLMIAGIAGGQDFSGMAKKAQQSDAAESAEQQKQKQFKVEVKSYRSKEEANELNCRSTNMDYEPASLSSWAADQDLTTMQMETQNWDKKSDQSDVMAYNDKQQKKRLRANCLKWEQKKSESMVGADGLIFDESRFARALCYDKSHIELQVAQTCQDFRQMQAAYAAGIELGPIVRAHKWGFNDIRRTPDRLSAEIQNLVVSAPPGFNLGNCSGEIPGAGEQYTMAQGTIKRADLIENYQIGDTSVAINRKITFAPSGCLPVSEELSHGGAEMTIIASDSALPKITFAHFPLLNYDATLGEYVFVLDGARKARLSRNDLIEVLNTIYGSCQLKYENGKCLTSTDYFQRLSKDPAAAEIVAKEIKAIMSERLKHKKAT